MKNVLTVLLIIGIIFLRFSSSVPIFKDGQKVRISGKILSEPVNYSSSQGLKLYNLTFYLPIFPEINYGDEIVVEGIVEKGQLKDAKLIKVEKTKNSLFVFREKLVNFYRNVLPPPDSSLVSGMVLGSKEGMSQEFWDLLKTSGTAHVVVASGMNATLIASFLISLFLVFFARSRAIIVGLSGVWIYTLLSGLDAPIVRAAIMATIGFGAQALGRSYLAWRGLTISIFVMLFLKPLWLTDLGFILSVAATVSLMLFEVKVNRLIYFIPSIFRQGLSTSFAAQVLVAPILYLAFGQFNILSPVANALVLWTVPFITILGGVSGIVGYFWFTAGRLILLMVYPLTTYFIWIVRFFG